MLNDSTTLPSVNADRESGTAKDVSHVKTHETIKTCETSLFVPDSLFAFIKGLGRGIIHHCKVKSRSGISKLA